MSAIIQPFENGVLGVLHGHWKLKLKTPLLIRAGSEKKAKSAFRQQAEYLKKGRGTDMELVWGKAKDKFGLSGWSEVTDFNYHFSVKENNQLAVEYSIPASSIRGSLRQWAIKSWIERGRRDLFSVPHKDGMTIEDIQKKQDTARRELENLKSEWRYILSLFGCAFDIDPEAEDHPLTWAGRMRINTKIESDETPKWIEACGTKIEERNVDGPRNIKRHVNVRNPIDRVTMAARDKGLHYALEMSEGEMFSVDFHILNPSKTDIDLIQLWTEDIKDGYLRFGGLTSQGRGRVEFAPIGKDGATTESYKLFVSKGNDLFKSIDSLGKPFPVSDELFMDFWSGAELSRQELKDIFQIKQGDCHVS